MSIKVKIIKFLKKQIEGFNDINNTLKLDPSIVVSGTTLLHDVKVGKNTRITDSYISNGTTIGDNCFLQNIKTFGNIEINEGVRISEGILKGNVSIGNYSSLWGPNVILESGLQKISVGNFCSVARNVSFQAFNHNYKKITSYYIGQNVFGENWESEKVSKGDIILENDVWIGANCVVLGGVKIHNGAVVAANSVVNTDVPAYSIVAGSPAKVIGYRFDNESIEKIQELKWWNWSIDKIRRNKHLFLDNWNNEQINKIDVNE